jgi:hypothetical protein
MLNEMSRFKRERLRSSIEKKFRRNILRQRNYTIDIDGDIIGSDRIKSIKVQEVSFVGDDGIAAKVAFDVRNLGVVVQEIEFGIKVDD